MASWTGFGPWATVWSPLVYTNNPTIVLCIWC